MTDPQRDGLDFSTIHAQERAAIREPEGSSGNAEKPWTGLAFSGGGIRSATFNLGILQALAEMKLLRQFDYLSCVSGGGYIGGWLSAFIHRCGGKVEDTEEQLKTGGEEIPAIRFLRSYSNYLTPKAGLFSADTLTAIATYLRNLYLNLTLLLLYLGALLLLPRLLVWLARWLTGWEGAHAQVDPRLLPLFGGGIACIGVAMLFIGLNLGNRDGFETRPPFYTRQGWVLALVAVPALLSAWLIGYGFYAGAHQLRDITLCGWVLWGMAVYVPPWFTGWGLGRLLGRGRSAHRAQFGWASLLLDGAVRLARRGAGRRTGGGFRQALRNRQGFRLQRRLDCLGAVYGLAAQILFPHRHLSHRTDGTLLFSRHARVVVPPRRLAPDVCPGMGDGVRHRVYRACFFSVGAKLVRRIGCCRLGRFYRRWRAAGKQPDGTWQERRKIASTNRKAHSVYIRDWPIWLVVAWFA